MYFSYEELEKFTWEYESGISLITFKIIQILCSQLLSSFLAMGYIVEREMCAVLVLRTRGESSC